MTEEQQKPRRKWQNLFHRKCPNCDERLIDSRKFYKCPNPDGQDPQRSCFFIDKRKLVSLLQDTEHPAHYCLNAKDKDMIPQMVFEIESSIPQ